MKKYFRAILIITILFSFVGCDQVTKFYALKEVPILTSISHLDGLIKLQFAENQGYFLGIGSTLSSTIRTIFTITITIIAICGFIVLLLLSNELGLCHILAYTTLLAGCLGNLIDRLLNRGLVIDFIIIGTNRIHTGILNIADILITLGISAILVLEVMHKRAT
jgi:signal peptidase II